MLSEFGFEPHGTRYGPFLVLGLFDTTAHIRPFLAIFGPFLRPIVELEGKKELFVMGQSRRTWSVQPFPFVYPFSLGFGAVLGQKRLFWGQKCAVLGGHLQTWHPRPGAPLVSFCPKTWIWQGHHLGSRMARVD